jgi:uncharacterized protein
MPAPRRFPQRTCVACRTERQKRDLVRVVRTPAGDVVLDESGRINGRGAYLCGDGSCWAAALKKSSLERALGVPLPAELRHRLEAGLPASPEGGPRGA